MPVVARYIALLALVSCGVKLDDPPRAGVTTLVDAAGSSTSTGGGEFQDAATIVTPLDAPVLDAPAAVNSLTATDFITQYGDLLCTEAFTCEADFPGTTNDFENAWDTNVTSCDADALVFFNPTKVETDIVKGKIVFTPNDATACLAGIAFGTCANFWATGGTFPATCDTALVGSVANGGGCVTDFECQSLFCNAQAHCQAQN